MRAASIPTTSLGRPACPVRVPIALLLPFAFSVACFWLFPVIDGFFLSLESNTLYGPSHYVGLQHYRALLTDARFLRAVTNTALYAALTVMVVLPLALALALLMRQSFAPVAAVVRFCLLLPGVTPPLVLGLLFVLVFSGGYGLLNGLTAFFGVPPVDWLQDPRAIKIGLVMQATWRWTGFIALFLMSSLAGIPREYYDVARAEGANPFAAFRFITLPLLRRALLFSAVVLILDAFMLFSGAYILLGGSGGTADGGLLLITYMYQTAFRYGRFASAAAMAYVCVPLLIVIIAPILTGLGSRRRT
jgi:ABC-type sugar transport system permease subunit